MREYGNISLTWLNLPRSRHKTYKGRVLYSQPLKEILLSIDNKTCLLGYPNVWEEVKNTSNFFWKHKNSWSKSNRKFSWNWVQENIVTWREITRSGMQSIGAVWCTYVPSSKMLQNSTWGTLCLPSINYLSIHEKCFLIESILTL